MKTMYCSKYALSTGVTEHTGKVRGDLFMPDRWTCTYWTIGRDVHETMEAACSAAEKMRQRKIVSVEKQLAKLRAMTFGN